MRLVRVVVFLYEAALRRDNSDFTLHLPQVAGATRGREDKTSRSKLSVSHRWQVQVRDWLGPLLCEKV